MGISVDIQEDTFLKKSIASYNLSAFVGADRFSFFAYDLPQQKVQLFRSYTFQASPQTDLTSVIHQVCTQDDLLQLPFQRRSFAITDTPQTFVPDRLFKEEAASGYLEKMIDLKEEDKVLVDDLNDLQIRNVYPVRKGSVNLLKGYFPGAELFHISSWFIQGARRLAEHRNGHQLYLSVLGNRFQVVLFEGRDFLFSNHFTFQSADDFVYFTMLIFEQFRLKPESVPVYLSGDILKDSAVYKRLYRYIRHLHFVQLPDFLNFGTQVKALPLHQSFNLFCAKLCV